jgi:hypothetical protein
MLVQERVRSARRKTWSCRGSSIIPRGAAQMHAPVVCRLKNQKFVFVCLERAFRSCGTCVLAVALSEAAMRKGPDHGGEGGGKRLGSDE